MRNALGVAALIPQSSLDNGEATSNDSRVTGEIVSLLVKSNVRHRHPKGEQKKTGLIESFGSTQLGPF